MTTRQLMLSALDVLDRRDAVYLRVSGASPASDDEVDAIRERIGTWIENDTSHLPDDDPRLAQQRGS